MNSRATLRPLVTRRAVMAGGLAITLAPRAVSAAADNDVSAAIRRITGGAPLREGRVNLDLPPLAENGNSVTMTVSVESPMTADDHVKSIHIVSEKNPIADVVKFHIGPRAGRARVSSSIRLATTQVVTAIAAMSDGTFWSGTAEVIVTLAACTEAG
jgi:sulfur-oxidizing protein SoxY